MKLTTTRLAPFDFLTYIRSININPIDFSIDFFVWFLSLDAAAPCTEFTHMYRHLCAYNTELR